MKISRRDFVITTVTGAAGLCLGGCTVTSHGVRPQAQLADEDGYRLWLRYAPPGDAIKNYRKIVRQICVEGSSPTSQIIRDELRKATEGLFGDAAPLHENDLVAVSIVIGSPGNSKLVRDLNWTPDL